MRDPEKRKEYLRAYHRTEEYRRKKAEWRRAYRQTEKGRAARAAYLATPEAKEKQKEYARKHRLTEKSKARLRRYNKSEKSKARDKRYRESNKGRLNELLKNDRRTDYFRERSATNQQNLAWELLNPARTTFGDLQDWLGRQLNSEEMDWWQIVLWTHADGFLHPRKDPRNKAVARAGDSDAYRWLSGPPVALA